MAERLAKASKREMYPNPNSSTLGINRISKSFDHRSLELCVFELAAWPKAKEAKKPEKTLKARRIHPFPFDRYCVIWYRNVLIIFTELNKLIKCDKLVEKDRKSLNLSQPFVI